jgi:hypothetical protein
VHIDRAGIPDWLPSRLDARVPDRVTVVFHSVVWQYLTEDERATVRATLLEAGSRARPDAPLAWLRLEPVPDLTYAELRLTIWPGGDERLLATTGFHVDPITWLA